MVSYFVFNNPNLFHLFLSCYDAHVVSIGTVSKIVLPISNLFFLIPFSIHQSKRLGKCEICKTKFRFDPIYAENAPTRLPAHEVILGLSSRFCAKWLPLALRIVFAAFLWLVLAPYLTNCLYLGWIIKPSSILTRREVILSDIVSGAVMGATIIISFLSLMSFADFLRVLWQRPPEEQDEVEDNGGRENVGAGGDDNNINVNINNNEDEIDNDNDNASDERIVEIMKKTHQQIEDDNDIDAIENDSLAPDDSNKKQSHDVTQIGTDQEVSDDRGHEAEQLLRDQATELRNLALEREFRRHNGNVEQERIPLHDVLNEDIQNGEEDDDDDNDSVVPPVDVINARLNDEIEEENDDDDSDYVDDGNDNDNVDIDEADQNEIDEEDAWMDEVEDEDENDVVPPLEQPPGGDVAFDLLDPVLQDDQVVSV